MALRLQVVTGAHRPVGSKKNYYEGESFDGTQGELDAFSDKLKLLPPELPQVEETVEAPKPRRRRRASTPKTEAAS